MSTILGLLLIFSVGVYCGYAMTHVPDLACRGVTAVVERALSK